MTRSELSAIANCVGFLMNRWNRPPSPESIKRRVSAEYPNVCAKDPQIMYAVLNEIQRLCTENINLLRREVKLKKLPRATNKAGLIRTLLIHTFELACREDDEIRSQTPEEFKNSLKGFLL